MNTSNTSKKTIAIFPVLLTVFIDLLGVGIAIPITALLFVDPIHGILSASTTFQTKNILYGLLIAIYPLAQFFSAPILGDLSDRYGRKKVLIISLIGTFIGYLLFGAAIVYKQVYLLFIGRFIDGVTGGNISVAYSAIADVSDKETKTKNFGLVGMMFGLGFILGPYIGGKLADPSVVSWFTFATPFWFAALLTLLNIVQMITMFKETLKTFTHKTITLFTGVKNIYKAFTLPNVRVLFFVIFLLIFGWSFFTQFFQIYLIEKFHFTQSQIGDLFAYIGIWIAIAQGGLVRPLSEKYSPKSILSVSMFLVGGTLLLLLLPQKASTLYFILPFIAIFQGLTRPNSTTIVSETADEHAQGEILGLNQSIQSLAQAIPPLIAGFVISINFSLPILLASIVSILAGLVFIFFYKEKKQPVIIEE